MAIGSFGTRFTLHCAREPSGADRYHQTLAFDAEGAKLADIPHCRAPRFVSDVLVCYEEVVNRDGVIELNPKLAANPELVNSDPYGEGWMVRMRLEDAAAAGNLMDAAAYQSLVG